MGELHKLVDAGVAVLTLPAIIAFIMLVRYISKIEYSSRASLTELRKVTAVIEKIDDRLRPVERTNGIMWDAFDRRRNPRPESTT